MSRFSYAWKSPDGVRHVDETTAANKEEVFASLRARGIKAIKVEQIVPRWMKFARGAALVCVGILVVVLALLALRGGRTSEPVLSDAERALVSRFAAQADGIIAEQEREIVRLGKEATGNKRYKAEMLLDLSRARLRTAYREVTRGLPADAAVRSVLETDYGRFTVRIDDRELSLEGD